MFSWLGPCRVAVLCFGAASLASATNTETYLAEPAAPAKTAEACTLVADAVPVLLRGVVRDTAGAPLAGATVSFRCGAEQRNATSADDGSYSVQLAAGQWQGALSAAGFRPLDVPMTVFAQSTQSADFRLELAPTRTQVEVHADLGSYIEHETEVGTHTNTPLLEVPQSVAIVPLSVLRDQQVVRLEDATRNVSGVAFGNDSGGRMESMVMRGFTTNELFKDGFRNDSASTRTYAELSNVERVEILKGPSSTVFGRLDPSGVINLVTREPQARPQMNVEMQGGSDQFLRPIVDMTGPLRRDGRLLGRFVGSGQDSRSFRDFSVQHRLFLSPTLTWMPNGRTTLRLYTEFLGGSGMSDRGLIALGTRPADLPISRYLADPSLQSPYREGKAGVSLDRQWKNWALRSYERSSTGFALYNARIASSLLSDQKTIKLNDLASEQYYQTHYWINEAVGTLRQGPFEHTVLIGAELDYELFDTKTARATNASAQTLNIYTPNYAALPARSVAVSLINQTRDGYGSDYLQDQVRYQRLTLTGGLRYDIAKMKTVGYYSTASSSSRNTAWTPRAGLSYRFAQPVAFYATWSLSFQPQSDQDVNGNPFKPERGKLLETGAKYDLPHLASGTVSIYQIDRTNVTTTDPNNTSYSIQLGAQRSRGIEWNQTTQLGSSWNLMSGYAFTQAQVRRDTTYVVGNGLVAAPRHTANLWMKYAPHAAWLQGASLGAGIFGASKSEGQLRTQAAPSTYFLLPGYTRVDLAASYDLGQRAGWHYRLAANVDNLLDRRYFNGSGGRFAVKPGAPRQFVLSLQLRR